MISTGNAHVLCNLIRLKGYVHFDGSVFKRGEKVGKMSIFEILDNIAAFPLDMAKDGKQALETLKGRVKNKYFSSVFGLCRRILALFFSRFQFANTETGQKFSSVEKKLAAKIKLSKSEVVLEIFSIDVKKDLEKYAKGKGITPKDAIHYKPFQTYLNKLAHENKQDIAEEFESYAENTFLKFVLCWREIELLYKKDNLSIISEFEKHIPERFLARHNELLQAIQ